MSDHDDLQAQMDGVRKERERRLAREQPTVEHEDTVTKVLTMVSPIVKAFVQNDRSLNIQSSDGSGYFIGYGFLHICRIKISAFGADQVQVSLESGLNGLESIYSGGINEEKIKTTVKDALVAWYRQIL